MPKDKTIGGKLQKRLKYRDRERGRVKIMIRMVSELNMYTEKEDRKLKIRKKRRCLTMGTGKGGNRPVMVL